MATQPTSFSKSKFMSCLQCDKRLWLELNRAELEETSAETEGIFAMGNAVGGVARSIYDPKSMGTTLDLSSLGVTRALARTIDLVKERKPIFEAGFSANGAMAFADVLLPVRRKEKPVWRMVEVKASTSVKDYHRNDVAVQAYVSLKSGLPLAEIAIAHIDSSWVYPGGGDYEGLLAEVDLTKEAFGRSKEVEAWVAQAQTVAAKRKEPPIPTGDHCRDAFDCSFIGYCTSLVPQPKFPAEWFPRKGKALKALIYESGLVDMRKVPDDALNGQQLRIKQHTLAGTTYFNAAGAAAELKPPSLPAFFLDFETISFAVPIWKGTRPYQQIPFQFSLHRLSKTGKLNDQSFLDLSGYDPSRLLAEALVKACEDGGPVYVYNAGFEGRVIMELAERFPKLKSPLMKIVTRMVDLLPVAQKHYCHPDMQGSWSLKAVLPTIVPDLDYDRLDGVQDGGMAQTAFLEAIDPATSPQRRDKIKRELLDYCRLDTYATVRLWQYFAGPHQWRL